jgi:hypothetical protein
MDCTDPRISERLLLFVEGHLPAEEQAAIASHVKECQACSADVASLSSVTSLIRSTAALQKGPCPSADEIIAAVEGDRTLPDGRQKEIQNHILSCASCREEALILEELRGQNGAAPASAEYVTVPASLVHAFRNVLGKTQVQRAGFLVWLERFFTLRRPFAYGSIVAVLLVCLTFVLLPKIIHRAGVADGTSQLIPASTAVPSERAQPEDAPKPALADRGTGTDKVATLEAKYAPGASPSTPAAEVTDRPSPEETPLPSPEKEKSTPSPSAKKPDSLDKGKAEGQEKPEKERDDKKAAPAPETETRREIAVVPTNVPEPKAEMKVPAPRPSRIEELPAHGPAATGSTEITKAAPHAETAPASTGGAAGPSGSAHPAEAKRAAAPSPEEEGFASSRERKIADEIPPTRSKKTAISSGLSEKSASPPPEDRGESEKASHDAYGRGPAPGGSAPSVSQGAPAIATTASTSAEQIAPPAAPAMPNAAAPQPPPAPSLEVTARRAAAGVVGADKVKSVSIYSQGRRVVVVLQGPMTRSQMQAVRRAVAAALGVPSARVTVVSR